jgi:hypothetical protein
LIRLKVRIKSEIVGIFGDVHDVIASRNGEIRKRNRHSFRETLNYSRGTSAERLMNGAGMKNPDYFRMNFSIERKG